MRLIIDALEAIFRIVATVAEHIYLAFHGDSKDYAERITSSMKIMYSTAGSVYSRPGVIDHDTSKSTLCATERSIPSHDDTDESINIKHDHTNGNGREHGLEAQSTPNTSTLRQWKVEIACWFVGSLCVGAIGFLLGFFQNRSLGDWHSKVKLNAIVSVLSQAAEALLLSAVCTALGQLKWKWYLTKRRLEDMDTFDEASRGAKGSLQLLWMLAKDFRSRQRSVRSRSGRSILLMRNRSLAALGASTVVLILPFGSFIQQSLNLSGIRWVNSTETPFLAIARHYNVSTEQSLHPG